MTTIKEIAKLAGVSRGTVDRVINNRGAVKQETAERIRNIADSLSYSPNRAGKTLAVRKKHLQFGYILFSGATSNPFFLDVIRGIESRATELLEYGVAVELRTAKIDNPHQQVALIDELVGGGIDGLAITPINHPAVVARIRQLTETGIPVVTANTDIADSGRLAYVGSDYFKSGCTAAGLMNLVTGGNAKVGIVIGNRLVDCHTERAAGFRQRIQTAYPGIRVVGEVINNDDDVESLSVIERLLQTQPEIDALYLTGAGVVGVCQAVENMGLQDKIKIISNDLPSTTRELVEKGAIAATITQQPFTQGAKPLDILLDYAGMDIQPETEHFYTKIEIKIRENI
jgi:LacI family transcriptional regulator